MDIPDFGLDNGDSNVPVNQTLPVVAAKIGIPSPADWGALALAILLMPGDQDIAEACADYNTSLEIVDAMLFGNYHPLVPGPVKGFQDAVREARREIASLGTDAGFILRARTVAEGHLTLIDELARSRAAQPQVRLKAIELAARLALLHPDTRIRGSGGDSGDTKASAVGVMVNISFGSGLPVPSTLVIDAVPTTPAENP